MNAIHQVVAVYAPRDAIGNHVVEVQKALRQLGVRSEIYAGEIAPGVDAPAHPLHALKRAEPGAALLYHASTGSVVGEWFAGRPERKLLDYHNITPAELITPWEPHIGVELEHGRRQLADLALVTEFALADSSFNESELIGLGYRKTAVLPIMLDTDGLRRTVDEAALARLVAERDATGGGTRWLFVSRVLPHKAQHDVIKAFAAYRRAYDSAARLTIVGFPGSARYAEALQDFIVDLDLEDAVRMTGSIPPGELGAHFRAADVFVCLSDHEGFAVPPLEAMANDVPVVAYAAGAVPETVGDGGLLLPSKEPTLVAAAVRRVVTDRTLRERLVARGRRRLAHFSLAATRQRLGELVPALVA